jgi:hypothetical protein
VDDSLHDGDDALPRWQRVYVAACAGVVGACLTYGLVDYARLPRLVHYQAEHELRLEARAYGAAPGGYVGLWVWALAAGVVAAALATAFMRARRQPLGEGALGLWLAWAMTAFGLVGAYFTWNNWP